MFRLELLSKKNINLLPSLFEDAFGERREVEQILIKYTLDNIFPTFVSFLVFHKEENELAGFYGVFPSKVFYEGNIYLCAQIGDLMTSSKYRRMGVFELVAKHTHQYLTENNFKFVYTFPSNGATSYYGFVNKLQFREKSINSYSVKITTLPLSRFLTKNNLAQKTHKLFIKFFCNFFFKSRINFFEISNTERDQIIHDKDLLEYKSNLSSVNLFLNDSDGEVFFKIDKDGGLSIGFINTNNEISFNRLLKKLKRLCFFSMIRFIHFEVSENCYLNDFLSVKFEKKQLYRVCYKVFDDSIDVSKIQFEFIDIDSF
jgi:hypothetical protein